MAEGTSHTERAPFAHRSEAEVARIFDFYGLRWEYEPHSFPLKRAADGRAIASFTPDFYLPDYDLYVEVTTMRPALESRKNRKIRLLRELYPGVNIKLLARRDLEALLGKYGRMGSLRYRDESP